MVLLSRGSLFAWMSTTPGNLDGGGISFAVAGPALRALRVADSDGALCNLELGLFRIGRAVGRSGNSSSESSASD